ncbi:hypothetical protein [Streptomyces kanamyceticus]|uniref:Uncharacterized protein n=1 Tax=Streptomyces kanamyceticus TaxID=1967 RepID=A0A5J6GT04_STRKN|nr:hypothetical protein [Streptomyces kanamyceticus]QEU96898.1 hypothetical protein CP970_43510 [Streptomyces kanamyceticus]
MHRNPKGFSRVDYALHGEVTSVHSDDGIDDVAFLQYLEGELGIYLPWEETEAELAAAAFTIT